MCKGCDHRWKHSQAPASLQLVRAVLVHGEVQGAHRRLWSESGTFQPGDVVEVEVRNANWVRCRVDRETADLLWVTRVDHD